MMRWITVLLYATTGLLAWFMASLVWVRLSDGDNWEVRFGLGGAFVVWGQYESDPPCFIKPFDYQRGIGLRWAGPALWISTWKVLGQQGVMVPAWPVALPLIIWWALKAERRHFRRQPGHCPGCGYDLTGNISGRCPECGRPMRCKEHA